MMWILMCLINTLSEYNFTKEAVGVDAKLLSEDGVDLGWEAVWEDQTEKILGKLLEHQTLKLQRGPNGKLLEHGTRYMIQIVVDEAWVYFTDMCECMECSWYKNHEFLDYLYDRAGGGRIKAPAGRQVYSTSANQSQSPSGVTGL